MKNNKLNLRAAATLAVSTLLAANVVLADDLPQTKSRQQTSVTQGFASATLPVLQRASAAGQNVVSAGLIGKLRPGSVVQTTTNAGILRAAGDQWSLEVSSDGASAEYQDLAVQARAHSLGRPLSQKMPAADLEKMGRAFIASKLASQIVLGEGEELLAVRADYRTDGGQDLITGKTTNAVVGNRIVFGRMLNGVPVVGNGSKVILTFSNDGALEGFRYDWPTYQAGAAQGLVDAGEILSRMQKVIGIRSGETAATAGVAVPNSGAAEYPLALTPNAQLQAMECGYYDSGSFARKTNSVQPGCTYLAVSQDAHGMRAGYAGAVPGGASFAADAGWLETQILGGSAR